MHRQWNGNENFFDNNNNDFLHIKTKEKICFLFGFSVRVRVFLGTKRTRTGISRFSTTTHAVHSVTASEPSLVLLFGRNEAIPANKWTNTNEAIVSGARFLYICGKKTAHKNIKRNEWWCFFLSSLCFCFCCVNVLCACSACSCAIRRDVFMHRTQSKREKQVTLRRVFSKKKKKKWRKNTQETQTYASTQRSVLKEWSMFEYWMR